MDTNLKIETDEDVAKHLLILAEFIQLTVKNNEAMVNIIEAQMDNEDHDYQQLLLNDWEAAICSLMLETQELEKSIATLYFNHTTFTLAK